MYPTLHNEVYILLMQIKSLKGHLFIFNKKENSQLSKWFDCIHLTTQSLAVCVEWLYNLLSLLGNVFIAAIIKRNQL